MTRTMAALVATLLILPGASPQDDAKTDKERAREEAQKKDEDAKAALKAYREKLSKAKSADDVIEAIQGLETSEPHPLIRSELTRVLETDRSIDVRIAAASALGKFKKDPVACDVLLSNSRNQKDVSIKKKCIQRFGVIAPFGKSVELKRFFNDENNEIVKEALDAIKDINSVRMLKPLIDLLGELEQIKEDKGDQGGGGPPLPGVPQGDSSNNQRLKRKRDLTDPTRTAINALWKKYDSKTKLNNYTHANAELQRNKTHLMKLQEAEDREDKGIKPEAPGETKDDKDGKDGKDMK